MDDLWDDFWDDFSDDVWDDFWDDFWDDLLDDFLDDFLGDFWDDFWDHFLDDLLDDLLDDFSNDFWDDLLDDLLDAFWDDFLMICECCFGCLSGCCWILGRPRRAQASCRKSSWFLGFGCGFGLRCLVLGLGGFWFLVFAVRFYDGVWVQPKANTEICGFRFWF